MVREAHRIAALLALAKHNIATDIQGLLLSGSDRQNVKPGALDAALAAALQVEPADSDMVDKADAWDAIAAKNATITALRDRVVEVERERDRLLPKPSEWDHLAGVCYRDGPVTAEDYDEAIRDMKAAKKSLVKGDAMGCSVCSDGGHGSNMCHHNALLLARKWVAATRIWQCYHCGFIATNGEEAKEHFGRTEHETASCITEAAEARATAAEAQVARMREALQKIAFLRPLGPTRNKMVEQMERIAIDALDALRALTQEPH